MFLRQFGILEKKAYKDHFNISDATLSRDQAEVMRDLNQGFSREIVVNRKGRLRCLRTAENSGLETSVLREHTLNDYLNCFCGPSFRGIGEFVSVPTEPRSLGVICSSISSNRSCEVTPMNSTDTVPTQWSPHYLVDVVGEFWVLGWNHQKNAVDGIRLSQIAAVELLPHETHPQIAIRQSQKCYENACRRILLERCEALSVRSP